MQKDKRVVSARDTLEFRFAPYPSQLWHEDSTVELAEGFIEKGSKAEALGNQRFENWERIPRLTDHGPDDDTNNNTRRSDRHNLSVPVGEVERSRLRNTPTRNLVTYQAKSVVGHA